MAKIDLHIHSNSSADADFEPAYLIQRAKEQGVKVMAIADHNTAKAYEKLTDFQDSEMTIIPGIEMDCTIDDINLHVLGYFIDPNYPRFEEIFQDILKQEQEAAAERIRLVEQLGIVVDSEKVMSMAVHGEVPGELIAEVVLADSRNDDHEVLKPYRNGGARSDNPYVNFYWDICSKGKPAYVPIHIITLEEAISVIHEAGGVAVLAHPGNNIHEDVEVLRRILACGVKGIEVYSSYHNEAQVKFYHDAALEAGCFMTCGSDFHGRNKPAIEIGSVPTMESFEELYQAILAHNPKQ